MEALTLTVELPKSIVPAAGRSERELGDFARECLAMQLYRERRISLGKVAEILGVPQWDLTPVMVRHGVYLHCTADDAERDAATLEALLG